MLLESAGKTMLAHHIERLQSAGLEVYVATTTNASDDPIAAEAARLGCKCYRGSEHDVLSRFAEAAQEYQLDVVVRVTSDCPLIDQAVVQRGIDLFLDLNDSNAYVSNTVDRTYPRGLDFEVMSSAALFDAERNAEQTHEREHVTPYLYQSDGRAIHQVTRADDASDLRVTLDTKADFALIRQLFESHNAASLDADGLISLLRSHPGLVAMNSHIEQKALPS